jgi:hypothetical protein
MKWLLPAALLALLAFISPAHAAPPPDDEQVAVAKVNKAIDAGVQYLRLSRKPNDQWESFLLNLAIEMRGGITALATLAMLNSGVRGDDPDVVSALNFLRGIEQKRTYAVALITMAFAEARNPKDLPVIQSNVNWLLKTALREKGGITGWGYPISSLDRPDASNTQYALLALYAGKQAGAKIGDDEWKQLRQLYLDTVMKEPGDTAAWSYVEQGKRASFTMTVAGVSGLVISRMALGSDSQQFDPATGVAAKCGFYPENEAIRMGMNWIGQNFAFEEARESKSTFYNVYGIERVGRLSGQRFIGRFDWYREGCDFLTGLQDNTGAWATKKPGFGEDANKVISTAFALLFLSKGRSPVLISKLAYGNSTFDVRTGILTEKGANPNILGWNRKHNDARNLTDFASRELFKNLPLGWQVYDPRRRDFPKESDILAEVGVLVQSPILYFNGHEKPVLTGQQQKLLKKYIEEGGFVIAEACCGSPDFAEGFRLLMREMFPESNLKKMPPEHAIWRTHFAVPPTEFPDLECMDRGCRTVLVFSPKPLAGYWEDAKFMPASGKPAANHGEKAFHLAGNIIAYATGMEPPKQRLSQRKIVNAGGEERNPPRGFVKPVQLKIGEEPPAPAAMRNLMGYLRDNAKLDVVLGVESLPPSDEDLFKYKFLYMHGRKSFAYDDREIENLKANLQSGGLLLADACCGAPTFDKSFRAMAEKMFPENKLVPIPVNDPLYSAKLNGREIKTVKRRERAPGNGAVDNDAGYEDLPPALEGIKIDGRWVVVYSKYDIGCALENHKSSDCLGHNPESAKRLAAAAVLYSLKR